MSGEIIDEILLSEEKYKLYMVRDDIENKYT